MTKENKFSYRSIVNSSLFTHVERDLLKVILDPAKEYSKNEVEKILNKEKKRKVK